MKQELLYQNFVPLSRVVNAAILDNYEDQGKTSQVYTHWALRGLFELNMQIIKGNKRSVYLPVSANTKTAALPADFNGAIFVGTIDDKGFKIPLKANTNLVNLDIIEEVPCESTCPKCNANKEICEGMQVSVETKIVVINGTNYEQTITKKLYENGDYFLESSIPYLDTETDTVVYRTSKEFVVNFDLKDCGCLEDTQENMDNLRICNPELYGQYYATCGRSTDLDGYEIFEENGLIQFSQSYSYSKVYLEYRASMVKINGQYQVPRIAFEALVEWIKWKSVQNKKSVSRFDKRDQFDFYLRAKSNLSKIKNQFNLSRIIRAALEIPKFDIFVENYDSGCCSTSNSITYSNPTYTSVTNSSSNSGGTSTTIQGYVPFSFGVIAGIAGAPTDGSSTWQNDSLKGGLNLNTLILNDTIYTEAKGDFTFDSVTGIIDISPNSFSTSDVLVGNYFKLI